MRITYISNIPITESSGGMSGINFSTFNQLKTKFEIGEYILINPRLDLFSKLKSNLLTFLNFKCNYHFFSESRLEKIRSKFISRDLNTDAYFFHGITPWIKIKPNKPYFCYNDACFETYVNYYNNREIFSEKDLVRIFKQEAEWLKNANRVFFQSYWALEETKRHYNLTGNNFVKTGVGGYIDIPGQDYYTGGFIFLFIAREFAPKGGEIAVDAFKRVINKYPNCQLWIVGDQPSATVLEIEGVSYKGFLSKEIAEEKQQLIEIFKNTFALIHPTKKDINPLVISELGYYGCPVISSNSFAIPEYVVDGKTGFLLDDPGNPIELEEKMLYIIENKAQYIGMRINTRKFALENNTWDIVGNRMISEMIGLI